MTKSQIGVMRSCCVAFVLAVALLGHKVLAVSYTTNTYTFNYSNRTALVNAGWDFIAKTAQGGNRNTESISGTTPPDVSYDQSTHPGALRVPVTIGDIWDRSTNDLRYPLINNTTNTFFRDLSSNWVSLRLDASLQPDSAYEQVNLTLYQDDDNFVSVAHTYNTYEQVNLALQTQGYSMGSPRAVNATGVATPNVRLRIDRDIYTDKVTGYYSLDGTNWLSIGTTSHALVNPRLCIWIGGRPASTKVCDVRSVVIVTSDDPVLPVLAAQPQQLIFNSIAGQPCTNLQQLRVVSRVTQASLNYTITTNSPWLSVSAPSGSTPGICDVSVDTTGLAVGTYEGAVQIDAAGAVSSVAVVKLIVNPDTTVRVANWRGGKAAAMTVWIDDSHGVAFDKLSTNGFTGTYALWGLTPPPGFFTNYYMAGMEMAGHTHDHPCFEVNEPTRRYEFEENIKEIIARTPATQSELISFAWPCGHTTIKEQFVAADYFLSARGYNINALEDVSPNNWMNLKSYNSHGFPPLPPSDFKTIVDAAIAQGKWANLVFHSTDDDDGAIAYAVGKDIWVDRADNLAKYIHQRDRSVITNYSETANSVQFDCYRLPIEPSSLRSFEIAIKTNDTLTFSVDVSGFTGLYLSNILVNGVGTEFTVNAGVALFSTTVTTNSKSVVLSFATNTPPVLPSQTNFSVDEMTLLVVTNTATDSDVPLQTLNYSLFVTNTLDGSPQTNAFISQGGVITWTPSEVQGSGNYTFTTVVADDAITPGGATNSFTVTVNEVNVAPTLPSQTNHIVFGGYTMTVVNTATDLDIPVNSRSYTLTATNPTGNIAVTNASIDANGIITWTPTFSQMPSTNLFTTVVTDTNAGAVNSQNLQATNTFVVIALVSPLSMPAQSNRVIDELTALLVTNTATVLTNPMRLGWIATNRIAFNYTNRDALLADGWSFWATNGGVGRDTEITDTNVGMISYLETNSTMGAVMRVPTDLGDLWSSLNDTRNSVFRDISTNWLTTRLKLSFNPTLNYQQAHMVLYQDDDNYVEVGIGFNGGNKNMLFIQESGGVPSVIDSATAVSSNVFVRMDRNVTNGNVSAFFSSDETNWVALGQVGQTLTNARLGIWTGAATSPFSTTQTICDFAWLDIVTTNSMPPLFYFLAVTNTANNSVVTNVSITDGGIISWIPSEAQGPGVYSFTTVVGDGALINSNSFTVTVNEVNISPVFATTPADVTVAEHALLTVTNAATDVDLPANTLTYQLIGAPGNAVISSNGVITWTPGESEGPGTNVIVTVVGDGTASVTNSFTVIVTEVNVSPVAANDNYTVTNGSLVVSAPGILVNDTDSDLPANVLTAVLVNGPTNGVLNLGNNGGFSYVANLGFNGVDVFTYRANDGLSNSPTATVVLTVLEQAFRITSVTKTSNVATVTWISQVGKTYRLLYKDNLTDAIWSVVPGDVMAATTLTSKTNFVGSSNQRFYRLQMLTNSAPLLSAQGNVIIGESTLLTLTNTASDIDLPNEILSYTLSSGTANATISGNGVIEWMPGEADGPGTNTFTTVVIDNGGLSATNSFTVIVTEVNNVPVFGVQSDLNIHELTTLTVTNKATDSDFPPNALSYTLLAAPTNATISPSGIIVWTPTEAQGPSSNIFLTVVSDGMASVTNSFVVVVSEVNSAPVVANDSYFLTNSVLTIAAGGILANDSDADLPANALTAVLVSGPTNGVLNLGNNGGFTYTPNGGFNGTDVFLYRANDGTTNSAVATVSITVSNLPFVITSVTINSGLGTVTWNSVPGQSYRVQYKDNLAAANWTDVNPVVTATNISASATNLVGGASQRFYRVQIVETPQPVILSLIVTNGVAVITWSSIPGKVYGLEYKRELTDTNWTEELPHITATEFTTTVTNNVGPGSQRFFQVKLIESPVLTSLPPIVVDDVNVSWIGGNAVISWPSTASKSYVVQYKNQLTDASWTQISPNVTATSNITLITNAVGNSLQRFYRVYTDP